MQNGSVQEQESVTPPSNDRWLAQSLQLAAALFEKAKTDGISGGPSLACPMTSVFLGETGQVLVLQGLLFHDHPAPPKDQHAVAVKLVALCTNARSVVDVCEAWTADHCAACSAPLDPAADLCLRCGASVVPPRRNPHRRGVLLSVLHVRESRLNYAWVAEARLAENGCCTAWADVRNGEPYPMNPVGRFEAPWVIDTWMNPHICLNLMVLKQFFGHHPSGKNVVASRIAQAAAPPGFLFLRLDPNRTAAALRSVALETLID